MATDDELWEIVRADAWREIAARRGEPVNPSARAPQPDAPARPVGDITALQALRASRQLIMRMEARHISMMLRALELGATWAEIGAALGLRPDVARQRFTDWLEAEERTAHQLALTNDSLLDLARYRAALDNSS